MSVFTVDTFAVKPEKQRDFMQLWRRFLKYKEANPKLFKELKSIKLFTQTFGSICGAYIWMMEFDSLADYEKWRTRIMKEEEPMKIHQEILLLIDPATDSLNIWNSVE